MPSAFLAIGSNTGDRLENILHAIDSIKNAGIKIVSYSSLYETTPYGYKTQSNFLNIVIRTETDILPHKLLRTIKEIEINMGRVSSFRWGPRLIDIDILLYENEIITSEDLTIPHKELTKRDFFLTPLIEIAGDICEPISKKPLTQFLSTTEPHILKKFEFTLS